MESANRTPPPGIRQDQDQLQKLPWHLVHVQNQGQPASMLSTAHKNIRDRAGSLWALLF